MPRLSESEFRAAMGTPMQRREAGEAPFDFWPYVDALPAVEFEDYDFLEGEVDSVYVEPLGRHEHALVACGDKNVLFVVVLDLERRVVHGHRLLNLRVEYGLET